MTRTSHKPSWGILFFFCRLAIRTGFEMHRWTLGSLFTKASESEVQILIKMGSSNLELLLNFF